MKPEKKKSYVEFPGVTAFMNQQPEGVRIEYDLLVDEKTTLQIPQVGSSRRVSGLNMIYLLRSWKPRGVYQCRRPKRLQGKIFL